MSVERKLYVIESEEFERPHRTRRDQAAALKKKKRRKRRREERMKKRGNEFYSFEFAVVYSCKRERERERVGGSEVLYCTH